MSDRYFLDTNIIVYAYESEDLNKQKIAKELIIKGVSNNTASISYQVIQEFVNVATKKFKSPIKWSDCQLFIDRSLALIWDVNPNKELIYSAINIAERWKYSFYDSLIIAAALEAGCSTLYSEDLQHKQKIYSVQIINPFV
ncbi:MAG: PIN domain-containing protein [Balneola sp.]|jgi:predicted nucleic acid-binding protein